MIASASIATTLVRQCFIRLSRLLTTITSRAIALISRRPRKPLQSPAQPIMRAMDGRDIGPQSNAIGIPRRISSYELHAVPCSDERDQSEATEETAMLRKFLLVTVAAASLSAASLAPTPASAWYGGWRGGGWGWGGGWGPGWRVGWGPGWAGPGWGWRRWGWGWGGPRFVVAPGFYGGGGVVRRLVPGPWGPRWVLVNRCW